MREKQDAAMQGVIAEQDLYRLNPNDVLRMSMSKQFDAANASSAMLESAVTLDGFESEDEGSTSADIRESIAAEEAALARDPIRKILNPLNDSKISD